MASQGNIVLSYHDTLLRQSDVNLLEDRKWINDNLITFWFEYLENEVYAEYAQSIGFLAPQVVQFIKSAAENAGQANEVSTILESLNLSAKKLILIPINDSPTNAVRTSGSHWSLLAFIADNGTFEHYDSFAGSVNHLHAQSIFNVLTPILIPHRQSDMELDFVEVPCTQQVNGYDCGIHLICNADAVCRKVFLRDERNITEIASAAMVKKMRNELKALICKLKEKNKTQP